MYKLVKLSKGLWLRAIKRVLCIGNCHESRSANFSFFDSLLNEFLRNEGTLFFVQIGANDGKSDDPIYCFVTSNREKVRGIAIEPVKDYFDELAENYRNFPEVTTLNIAIHNSMKKATIYRVDPRKQADLPRWTKGIASFNEDHHSLSNTPRDAIITERTDCMSLAELVENKNVTNLDLLQIDTEGYDSEIILNIDFDKVRPKIIHFEHGLKDGIMTKEKFTTVADLLHSQGYEIWMDRYDATAYQREILIQF